MSRNKGQRKDTLTHLAIILALFCLAFCIRYLYVTQISHAPYFENPAGDSRYFFERAQEIRTGDIAGHTVPFYSSPLYPYFIAGVFWLFGQEVFILYIIQILLGAANCVVIYLLARMLSKGRMLPALISGVCAALYGLLVFFDADMLMIFMTLLFVDCGLYFLIAYRESRRLYQVAIAGLAIGLAALDRTNILLFVPFAMWYVAGAFTFAYRKWQIKPVLIFLGCVIGVLLPVTLRNVMVGNDLVLVSSNAGVNLYIGNNPDAPGVFYLPERSGLSNEDLQGTAEQVAERALGRDLRPSQVSGYWAARASEFMVHHPLETIGLVINKFLMFWNAYEVPNNLDYYFVREHVAPVLKFAFMGFWLLAPIAIVGCFIRWQRGMQDGERLLMVFLVTYMVSVLPFFITGRYRLPVIPVLIVFAGLCVDDVIQAVRERKLVLLIMVLGGIAAAAVFVNWPRLRFDQAQMRMIMGTRFLERGLSDPGARSRDLEQAVLHLKWALELRPHDLHVRYELGRTYASLGFYSGAIKELEQILAAAPDRTTALGALQITRSKYEETGDRIIGETLPKTPFELALMSEYGGSYARAREGYRAVIEEDPFHFQSYHRLAGLLQRHGRDEEARRLLETGAGLMPLNLLLLYDLGTVYYLAGDIPAARRAWLECLKIEPDNQQIRQALRMLEK